MTFAENVAVSVDINTGVFVQLYQALINVCRFFNNRCRNIKNIFDMEVEYETRPDNSGQFHSNGMSAITGITLTAPMVIGETLSGLGGSDIRIFQILQMVFSISKELQETSLSQFSIASASKFPKANFNRCICVIFITFAHRKKGR